MGFVGKLEDLGLGEILQIIHLSSKSGVLLVTSRDRKCKILFREGVIVSAFTNQKGDNILVALIRHGKTTVLEVRAFSETYRAGALRYEEMLIEKGRIDPDELRKIVAPEIERVIKNILTWDGGEFNFDLKSVEEELERARANPLRLVLEQGLNPQEILLHAAVDRDHGLPEEPVRPGTAEGESRAGPESESELAVAPDEVEDSKSPEVFIVDDDPAYRSKLAQEFERRGRHVSVHAAAAAAVTALSDLIDLGVRPIVLVDLIMPRTDGQGLLGGIELLQKVRSRWGNQIGFCLMVEEDNEDIAARAQSYGVDGYFRKPGDRSPAAERDAFIESVVTACESLADRQLEAAEPERPPEEAAMVDLGQELFAEIGREIDFVPYGATKIISPKSAELAMLKSMIYELSNMASKGAMHLLVLRLASEMMSRAVLFQVADGHAVGFGQFGVKSPDGRADERVRGIRIPLDEPSFFREAYESPGPIRRRPPDGPWERYFYEQLSGEVPPEAIVASIRVNRRVVSLLYADNAGTDRPIGDTEILEIFLAQIGIALDQQGSESWAESTRPAPA